VKFHAFIIRSYTHESAKKHFIIFNCSKVIECFEWPRWRFWHSQNVCRTKDALHLYCNATNRRLNKEKNNSPVLAFNRLVFYFSVDRSLWQDIPDPRSVWKPTVGSVNSKCFTEVITKLAQWDDITKSEKIAKMGFLFRNFFQGRATKFREHVFYYRRTYVVWQSFEKIDAETAEEACLENKLDVKYNSRSLLHRGRP